MGLRDITASAAALLAASSSSSSAAAAAREDDERGGIGATRHQHHHHHHHHHPQQQQRWGRGRDANIEAVETGRWAQSWLEIIVLKCNQRWFIRWCLAWLPLVDRAEDVVAAAVAADRAVGWPAGRPVGPSLWRWSRDGMKNYEGMIRRGSVDDRIDCSSAVLVVWHVTIRNRRGS